MPFWLINFRIAPVGASLFVESAPFKETCLLRYLAELVFLLVVRWVLVVARLLSFCFFLAVSVVSYVAY